MLYIEELQSIIYQKIRSPCYIVGDPWCGPKTKVFQRPWILRWKQASRYINIAFCKSDTTTATSNGWKMNPIQLILVTRCVSLISTCIWYCIFRLLPSIRLTSVVGGLLWAEILYDKAFKKISEVNIITNSVVL